MTTQGCRFYALVATFFTALPAADAAIVIDTQSNYTQANTIVTIGDSAGQTSRNTNDWMGNGAPVFDETAVAIDGLARAGRGSGTAAASSELVVNNDLVASGTFAASAYSLAGAGSGCSGTVCGSGNAAGLAQLNLQFITDTPYHLTGSIGVSGDSDFPYQTYAYLYAPASGTSLLFDDLLSPTEILTADLIIPAGVYSLFAYTYSTAIAFEGSTAGPFTHTFDVQLKLTAVPLPAGVWLLLSALGLAGFLPRRRRMSSGAGSVAVGG